MDEVELSSVLAVAIHQIKAAFPVADQDGDHFRRIFAIHINGDGRIADGMFQTAHDGSLVSEIPRKRHHLDRGIGGPEAHDDLMRSIR